MNSRNLYTQKGQNCNTTQMQKRDAMKTNKKEMLKGYRCVVKGCKVEPHCEYFGRLFCDVHLKEEWRKVLNESVR